MPVAQDRLSRVYRWWKVTTPDDLTGSSARVAFAAEANTRPATEDWTEADLVQENGAWWIRLLVGPGGTVELAPGTWQEWTEIEDNPELVVLKPGITEIL